MPSPSPSKPASLALVTLALLLAGSLSLPALMAADPARSAASARAGLDGIDQEIGAPDAHCAPRLERQLSSQVVEAGTSLQVDLSYHYRCPEGKRQVFFMILVENSSSFGSGFGGRSRASNTKDGLQAFVEHMDFETAGSRGGLILYSAGATVQSALRGGPGGKQALISAIGGINSGGGSAAGADDAIDLAVQELDSAPAGEDIDKVILLVDSGEALEAGGQAALDACTAVRDQGIRMAVVGLEPAEGRMQDCADERFYIGSVRGNGEDVPDRIGQMGDGLARAHHIDLTQYTHLLSQYFDYVEGSARPREPDVVFAGELFWEFAEPPPDEGYTLSYRLRPIGDISNEIVELELESSLDLGYADTSLVRLQVEPAEICVHSPNSPGFCDDFAATLTPPVPTDTPAPSPTITPTSDEPTPTEAPPEPTGTPPPPTSEPAEGIFLPMLLANAAPEG